MGRQEDVRGFHIPMHDAVLMGVLECLRNFDPVAQRIADRQRTAHEAGGEIFALEELHCEVVDALLAAGIEEATNVRVFQVSPDLPFEIEAGNGERILREAGGDRLDRHNTIEGGVTRAVHERR